MDSIFIFGLALILFGPKKLPEIGRQIGKIVLEFRKASNEFKMQIEDELRASEQAERQKKIAEETAALTAGTTPGAAIETSTPSGLTLQPPTVGEQVSHAPFRTGAEQLASVRVQSPGEDANPDAIAEVYPSPQPEAYPSPSPDAYAGVYPLSGVAPDVAPDVAPGGEQNSAAETEPQSRPPVPTPPMRESQVEATGSHVDNADRATTHHG